MAEIDRLTRAGLPDRAYLSSNYESHSPQWKTADDAGDGDAAFLLGQCLSEGIGSTADPIAAAGEFDSAARRGSINAMIALGLAYELGRGVARDYAAAVSHFRQAADLGSADAMFLLGLAAEHGYAKPAPDHDEALRWYQSAEKTGLPIGLEAMAGAYSRGIGMPVDRDAGAKLFERAAAGGYTLAMVTLGNLSLVATETSPADTDKAIEWYTKAVNAGSTDAMIRMALLYASDKLGPRDLPTSINWLTRAADLNDPEALRLLGGIYCDGIAPVIPVDVSRGIEFYRRAAHEGDILSLRWLGSAYEAGRLVARDPAEVRRCYKLGAEAGDAQCMSFLAATCSTTAAARGYTPDSHTEIFWLRRAIAIGNADAMNDMAVCYLKGDGEPVDLHEAVNWFRKAALAGSSNAMNSMGLRYDRGEGVEANPAEALRWFDMAARHGNPQAAVNLASSYTEGKGDPFNGRRALQLLAAAITQFRKDGLYADAAGAEMRMANLYVDSKCGVADAALARRWAERASADGNPHAWANLGHAAATGEGMDKDPAAAFEYYQKGANAHDMVAMLGLGECCKQGLGCTPDEQQAMQWFRKAADAGSGVAMREIALLLWRGKTTPRDLNLAAKWLQRAADLNDPYAIGNLAIMTGDGIGVPQDMDTALVLARRAEAAGLPVFVGELSKIYQRGDGNVPKDLARAAALMQEAADHGDLTSKKRLAELQANADKEHG